MVKGRMEENAIERVQLILHIPQLQYRLQHPEPVIPSHLCFFKSLEQFSEKSVHDTRRNVSYLYGVACGEMIFEQVIIYYANSQISFSYKESGSDTCGSLMRQLNRENIHFLPLSTSFTLRP
ncbi:hypothetical protein SporoP37_12080 [Sporosarcina sp. P37]|uniref:hypothetical protein n=1 Tax=unclassified Sporosarcina TaxID=2647733 RepID=UPI000A179F58|nr:MULTISPECIES: hypothetical protein [unclassified Sporosarcina]ARK25321.1 hypothetical protein SporoP37_12080 [Sporosarcina sp. P37]PID17556.1 hypothetical protein CSV62_13080 [Sporosarcina sp. P35]